MTFRNTSGISVEGFLQLLALYLKFTLVGWGDRVYEQKAGILIRSRVAQVLSKIFRSEVDETIDNELAGINLKVFRYVDDYLVLVKEAQGCSALVDVMKTVNKKSLGIDYTFEVPKQREIQVLDKF